MRGGAPQASWICSSSWPSISTARFDAILSRSQKCRIRRSSFGLTWLPRIIALGFGIYVEVKTVRPKRADSEEAWQKYLYLKQFHPETVDYVVTREGMGGAIHGNEYTSRQRFLEYTMAFEERLAAAKAIKKGVGVLVFCGNGFAWRLSNLEDFADFYRNGVHREDDCEY
jgi:hypothetical protein